MSELDPSLNVVSALDSLKKVLSLERQIRKEHTDALNTLSEYLEASKGKSFMVSGISHSAGQKFIRQIGDQSRESWTFAATHSLTEEIKPFEAREMVNGGISKSQLFSGTSVELFYPGVDNFKILVGLDSIIQFEPLSDSVPTIS